MLGRKCKNHLIIFDSRSLERFSRIISATIFLNFGSFQENSGDYGRSVPLKQKSSRPIRGQKLNPVWTSASDSSNHFSFSHAYGFSNSDDDWHGSH